ncbi:hypothetical protein SNEBB_004133 [Seison nebaliae]|nr:hypothetical protein SNEBB_004133 [Seison nebaliae]
MTTFHIVHYFLLALFGLICCNCVPLTNNEGERMWDSTEIIRKALDIDNDVFYTVYQNNSTCILSNKENYLCLTGIVTINKSLKKNSFLLSQYNSSKLYIFDLENRAKCRFFDYEIYHSRSLTTDQINCQIYVLTEKLAILYKMKELKKIKEKNIPFHLAAISSFFKLESIITFQYISKMNLLYILTDRNVWYCHIGSTIRKCRKTGIYMKDEYTRQLQSNGYSCAFHARNLIVDDLYNSRREQYSLPHAFQKHYSNMCFITDQTILIYSNFQIWKFNVTMNQFVFLSNLKNIKFLQFIQIPSSEEKNCPNTNITSETECEVFKNTNIDEPQLPQNWTQVSNITCSYINVTKFNKNLCTDNNKKKYR